MQQNDNINPAMSQIILHVNGLNTKLKCNIAKVDRK